MVGMFYMQAKALGWGHSQNKGPRIRWYWVWPCILRMSPTLNFTYCKTRSKIYHEPNLCKSQGIWMEGFLCPLFNSGRVFTPTFSFANWLAPSWLCSWTFHLFLCCSIVQCPTIYKYHCYTQKMQHLKLDSKTPRKHAINFFVVKHTQQHIMGFLINQINNYCLFLLQL
jgi:hypothetical protein